MTADDLTRLRDDEDATPGRWANHRITVSIDEPNPTIIADADAQCIATFDPDTGAALDPPTVAALIDRVERAERERDEARRVVRSVLDRAATTPLRDMVGGHPVVTSDYLFGQLRRLLTEGADDGQ